MKEFGRFISSSVGKKAIMAASGAMLLLFLLVHVAGNSTMFFGKDSFNSYAEKLHGIGFMLHVFEALLLSTFLLHIFLGLLLFIENINARPSRYTISNNRGGRTVGSRTMPYTGFFILFFVLVHLYNFRTTSQTLPSQAVREVLGNPGFTFFYVLAGVAVALHVSHGAWSLFQSLGLNHMMYDRILRVSAIVLSLGTGLIFILIPTFTLGVTGFLL
jgi:succinate dehydrogenase / fumarate reductase cytochrome b subunit